MRFIPIDGSRITLLASGKLMPKPVYGELADGSRRRVPGQQAKCEITGAPLWIVDCFLDDDGDDDGRAEIVAVTVPSQERPEVAKFRPVNFEGLEARAYVRDGRVAMSFTADRIKPAASVKAA